ncbi:MAG: type II secretion system protein GspL [Wenzhouxiangella sp.]
MNGKDKLVVHASGERWSWWRINRQGAIVQRGACEPGQPDWSPQLPVTLIISALDCLGLRLDLPVMSARRQQQALRWAAEEHLAGSADGEHVVAGPRDAEGRLCVVVISEDRLRQHLDGFAEGQVDCVVPDALCLPWNGQQLSLAGTEDSVLARWGDWEFAAFDRALASDLLPEAAVNQAPWRWLGGSLPDDWKDDGQDAPLEIADAGLESHWIQAALKPPINLLSGAFAPGSRRDARRGWQWAAGVAIAAVVLGLAVSALELAQLRSQSAELQRQADETFQRVFPGVTPAGRHRELAERELARMRFGASGDLLAMMGRLAPVVDAQVDIVLEGLSYRDGGLELSVRGPDVASLDGLERRLSALGMAASLQSTSMGDDGARARLRVSEGRG